MFFIHMFTIRKYYLGYKNVLGSTTMCLPKVFLRKYGNIKEVFGRNIYMLKVAYY